MNRALTAFAVAGLALALAGCASDPVSANVRQEAQLVAVTNVEENFHPYVGKMVTWGGRIIRTENETNNSEVYVLDLPLRKNDRPVERSFSLGRFIAEQDRVLDPDMFQPGRYVTIAGTIVGVETKPVQHTNYNYPVVRIDQIHVWPQLARGPYYPYPAWGAGPEVREIGPGWTVPGAGLYY